MKAGRATPQGRTHTRGAGNSATGPETVSQYNIVKSQFTGGQVTQGLSHLKQEALVEIEHVASAQASLPCAPLKLHQSALPLQFAPSLIDCSLFEHLNLSLQAHSVEKRVFERSASLEKQMRVTLIHAHFPFPVFATLWCIEHPLTVIQIQLSEADYIHVI